MKVLLPQPARPIFARFTTMKPDVGFVTVDQGRQMVREPHAHLFRGGLSLLVGAATGRCPNDHQQRLWDRLGFREVSPTTAAERAPEEWVAGAGLTVVRQKPDVLGRARQHLVGDEGVSTRATSGLSVCKEAYLLPAQNPKALLLGQKLGAQ
jgi:hypothetical protein